MTLIKTSFWSSIAVFIKMATGFVVVKVIAVVVVIIIVLILYYIVYIFYTLYL